MTLAKTSPSPDPLTSPTHLEIQLVTEQEIRLSVSRSIMQSERIYEGGWIRKTDKLDLCVTRTRCHICTCLENVALSDTRNWKYSFSTESPSWSAPSLAFTFALFCKKRPCR